MGVEYPRTHDAAPVLVETIRRRRVEADPAFLDWLSGLSGRLAENRGPAFYHEIEVGEAEALAPPIDEASWVPFWVEESGDPDVGVYDCRRRRDFLTSSLARLISSSISGGRSEEGLA